MITNPIESASNFSLESIINRLREKGFITDEHANAIIENNDVNTVDDIECSALIWAISKANPEDIEDIQALLTLGAKPELSEYQGMNAFITAVNANNTELVEQLLATMPDESLVTPDVYGRNALHYAAAVGHSEMLNRLLKDSRFKAIQNQPNIDGITPLNFAIYSGMDDCIKQLTDESLERVKASSDYNAGLPENITQGKLDDNLIKFLTLMGRKAADMIHEEGFCNAWAFLYHFYRNAGMLKEYKIMQQVIANWDGEQASLSEKIPDSLAGTPILRKHATVENVFERIANDVITAFGYSNAIDALEMKIEQSSRKKQFDLLNLSDNNELNDIAHYSFNLDKTQLTEILNLIAHSPGTYVDLGSFKHQTSIYITPEGSFEYYESNLKADGTYLFSSAETLADFIINTKYKLQRTPYAKVFCDFHLYQFVKKSDLHLTASDISIQEPPHSPNQFNAFHYAVMRNDENQLMSLLKTSTNLHELLTARDAHGVTPIIRALEMGYSQLAIKMIAALDPTKPNNNFTSLAFDAAFKYNDVAILKLILNIHTVSNLHVFMNRALRGKRYDVVLCCLEHIANPSSTLKIIAKKIIQTFGINYFQFCRISIRSIIWVTISCIMP